MRKVFLPLCIFFSCLSHAGNFEKLSTGSIEPANTYVFIAGVLKWQNPSLTTFSNKNRKDQELYDLLLSKGVNKANTVYLKDEEATLASMNAELKNLLSRATPGSTFIFYYAGHGARAEDGPVCFANYDYKAGNGFAATTVSEQVKSFFKGKQVWLLADCCFSGSLMEEAKKISGSGKSVVTFTSSTSSNISTGNWTFTQTMIDCLSGLAVCDRNSDKKITLSEVRSELFDAMKYREKQLSGTVFYNVDEAMAFNMGNVQPGIVPKAVVYIYMQQNLKFEPARVLSYSGVNITGELYHYSDKMTVTVPVARTKEIAFAEYPAGAKVQVEWNGKYYPAEIKEVKNGFHYVHYTGYNDSWNEWVMYNRINSGNSKKCSIEWMGAWYPGEMLQEKNGKYFVHYIGYGNDWDEWVGKERIRL
ncbi:MAG TPA: Tudor-knot domain-containing protein [Chitinophagaceae bacterium]|nr:Tudor-knot domain-containing protein [Chitinophagaceae bacterium]